MESLGLISQRKLLQLTWLPWRCSMHFCDAAFNRFQGFNGIQWDSMGFNHHEQIHRNTTIKYRNKHLSSVQKPVA